jgi:hypothetical protein
MNLLPVRSSLRIFGLCLFVLSVMVMLLSIVRLAFAQDTATAVPSIPPYPFPYLYCPHVVSGEGGTWRGITIGESTIEDAYILMAELSDGYTIIDKPADEGIGFYHDSFREAYEKDIPASVLFCTQDNVITALDYSPRFLVGKEPTVFLDDFVGEYGVPDAVTWANSSTSRVVFWFEEGIAASVAITETYGSVFRIVYIPYQPVEGYELRWPFNQTQPEPPEHYEGGKQPLTEQNPFDFEAIGATLTAQPSSAVTVTPTP